MYYRETEDTMKTLIYVMETKLFKTHGWKTRKWACPEMS